MYAYPPLFFYEHDVNIQFPKLEIIRIRQYLETVIANLLDITIPKISRLFDSNIDEQSFLKFRDSMKNAINDAKLRCKICNEIQRMRLYIGKHIMSGRLKHHANLCGHCGIIGCTSELKQGYIKGILKPKSNCMFYYEFNLKSVSKKTVSDKSPCSNRPVLCNNCNSCYWSYNLEKHYEFAHPMIDVRQAESDRLPTDEERQKIMKIP